MPRAAVLFALASAALFGASTPLAKMLLGAVPPLLLAATLYLGSGVGLLCWLALRRAIGRKSPTSLGGRDYLWLGAAIAAAVSSRRYPSVTSARHEPRLISPWRPFSARRLL
jgi:hypothetical protein